MAGIFGFDVPVTELRAEAFQELYLARSEFDLLLLQRLFQLQEAVKLGVEVVACPDAADAARADLDALEGELLGHPQAPLGRVGQAVVEDSRFDRSLHPIGVRAFCSRKPVKQALGAVGLVVAADFVELLAGIAHDAAGFGDVLQIRSKF